MIALPHSKSLRDSYANIRGYFTGIHVGKKLELGFDLKTFHITHLGSKIRHLCSLFNILVQGKTNVVWVYSKHIEDNLLYFYFARWVSSINTIVEFKHLASSEKYALPYFRLSRKPQGLWKNYFEDKMCISVPCTSVRNSFHSDGYSSSF